MVPASVACAPWLAVFSLRHLPLSVKRSAKVVPSQPHTHPRFELGRTRNRRASYQ